MKEEVKKENITKKYLLYLIRWQLSTPIIAVVLSVLSKLNPWVATVIANFIGGLMFFWIDRTIFKKYFRTIFS